MPRMQKRNPSPNRALRRADIKTIARETRYSVGTVSMALNNSPLIRLSTREKIREAAARLGYVPNIIAQLISARHSLPVGIIVPNSLPPLFPAIIHGIMQEFELARQPAFVTFSLDRPANESYYLNIFSQLRVRGLIVAPCPGSQSLPQLLNLQALGTQILQIDRKLPSLRCDYAGHDNRTATRQAVTLLWQAGHRRIGLAVGGLGFSALSDRVAGYRDALRRHGLADDPALTVRLEYDHAPVKRAAHQENVRRLQRLLQREQPTALVLALNATTTATQEAAASLGLQIPEDLNLVSFDQDALLVQDAPSGLRVIQSGSELGHVAGRMMIERIRDPKAKVKRTILPMEIWPTHKVTHPRQKIPRPQALPKSALASG